MINKIGTDKSGAAGYDVNMLNSLIQKNIRYGVRIKDVEISFSHTGHTVKTD